MVLLARRLLGNVSGPPLCRWYPPTPSHSSPNSSVVYDFQSGDHVVVPCSDAGFGGRGIQHVSSDWEFCGTGDYIDCCSECDCEGCCRGGDCAGEFVGGV